MFIELKPEDMSINLQGGESFFKRFFHDMEKTYGGPLDPILVTSIRKEQVRGTYTPESDFDNDETLGATPFSIQIPAPNQIKLDLSFWQSVDPSKGNHSGFTSLASFENFVVGAVKNNAKWFQTKLTPHFYGLYWYILQSAVGYPDTPLENKEDQWKVFHVYKDTPGLPKGLKRTPTLWAEVALKGFRADHKVSKTVGGYQRVTLSCHLDFDLKKANLL